MSYFNSNITGGSGSSGGGLVTKLEKTVTISSSALAEITVDISDDISNYANITNDRIIVELNNANAIAVGDSKLSHTYDGNSGIITITSTNSNVPFASSTEVELSLNIYVAGAVQMPPAPILPAIENISVNQKAGSSVSGYSNFNFVVDVGQMAILSGAGTWSVTNANAILDSVTGYTDQPGGLSDSSITTKIVLPTEETGAVSCSGSFGGTSWVEGLYILLDIN